MTNFSEENEQGSLLYKIVASDDLTLFNALVNSALQDQYELRHETQMTSTDMGVLYVQGMTRMGNIISDKLLYELIVDQNPENVAALVQVKIDAGYELFFGTLITSGILGDTFGQVVTMRSDG